MEPVIFEELTDLVNSGDLGDDRRRLGDTFFYDAYRDFVSDNLKTRILDVQISEIQEEYNIYTSGLTFNPFGYTKRLKNLPLVKHCNLWFDDWEMADAEIQEQIRLWIRTIYKQDLQYCYFMNKPEIRTVVDKPHIQLFINLAQYV